jgi:hypothetical protein
VRADGGAGLCAAWQYKRAQPATENPKQRPVCDILYCSMTSGMGSMYFGCVVHMGGSALVLARNPRWRGLCTGAAPRAARNERKWTVWTAPPRHLGTAALP